MNWKRLFAKPGQLDDQEFREIAEHTVIGHRIVAGVDFPWPQLPEVVRWHHERADGSGYPDQLHLDELPLAARIMGVADSFDAMSSTRPYRNPLAPHRIDEIFRSGAGGQWDPKVVDALFACRGDLEQIRQKGLGVSLVAAVDDMVNKFK